MLGINFNKPKKDEIAAAHVGAEELTIKYDNGEEAPDDYVADTSNIDPIVAVHKERE